ncbi:MAG: RNA helicase [Cyanobacteriota bacterium]|nr:RNA helicase [Cyanobacteriota bacterium]
MDWVDDDSTAQNGRLPGDRPPGDRPQGDRPLGDRLEHWVSRGRELVDGVAGTRPGTRGMGGGARRRSDGLGRWVEGKLDWLLDDRDDWREPWETTDRPVVPSPSADRVEPSARRSRPPLEAISRRGAAGPSQPVPPQRSLSRPVPPVVAPAGEVSDAPVAPLREAAPRQDWPDEEAFTVPRWRRQEPPPAPPVDPLAAAPPPSPPGRPLPRSTRRR